MGEQDVNDGSCHTAPLGAVALGRGVGLPFNSLFFSLNTREAQVKKITPMKGQLSSGK